MCKAENVIFDLGGVLYTLDFDTFWDGFCRKCRKNVSEIKEALHEDDLLLAYECGEISSKQYYETITQRLECNLSFTEFKIMWNSLLIKCEDMFRVVIRLKKYTNIFVLSNTNEINAEVLDVDLLPVTSHIIYSFQVGCMKPHREIYEIALEKWCISPARSVFIDDTRENCEGARKVGLSSHLFSEIEPFLHFLRESGVLTDAQSLDLVGYGLSSH